jgi:thioredoxin 1
MQQVNQENWVSVVNTDSAVLQFSAQWCGPCRQQAQILNEVETSNSQTFFGKIDIEESFNIADTFKVQSVPTIIFLKNGKESKRLVGFQNKQKLQEAMSA